MKKLFLLFLLYSTISFGESLNLNCSDGRGYDRPVTIDNIGNGFIFIQGRRTLRNNDVDPKGWVTTLVETKNSFSVVQSGSSGKILTTINRLTGVYEETMYDSNNNSLGTMRLMCNKTSQKF